MYPQSRKLVLASGIALAMAAICGAVTTGTALAQVPASAPEIPTLPASPIPLGGGSPLDGARPMTPTVPESGQGSASGSVTSPFAALDANADGKLSKSELKGKASLGGNFKSADVNRDGYLNPAEFAAFGSVSATTTKPKRK